MALRILLTGANGFIGGRLLAGLRARGHIVVAAVRDPAGLYGRWPDVAAIAVDFNRDTTEEIWRPRLAGIDAVINCAGVLHSGRGQDIDAIHATTPMALFDACVAAGVGKVIQISAISADAEVGTTYALTKKRADDHLRTCCSTGRSCVPRWSMPRAAMAAPRPCADWRAFPW
jgi:uncharacterized protein YbjT (DUF2867 family)